MPKRSIRHLLAALLILAVASLATFGTARPAAASTAPTAIDPGSVDFGTLPVGQSATFYLSLALPEPADISIAADADWIDVYPAAVSSGTTTLISVRPITTRVAEPREYTGTIVVRAGSLPPLPIPVHLQVVSPEAPQAGSTASGPFEDVPGNHWARSAIAELAASRVINGVGDGRFAPDDTVTREQFAKLLVMAFGLSHDPEPTPYKDVPIDRWSAPYIVSAGPFMARHFDGLFHPEAPATREEIAVALVKIKGMSPARNPDLHKWFTDYAKISRTAQPWVTTARAAGLIGGFPDRTFRPQDPVTRAQVAVLLQRALGVCGTPGQAGCPALLGVADQTLAGVTLKEQLEQAESTLSPAAGELSGYANLFTRIYREGNVRVEFVTPSPTVWSVLLQGEGATPRGIKIGDSMEAVRKAYGPQGDFKNGVLTYQPGDDLEVFYLKFFFAEGKVHAIQLVHAK